jgi:lycopene cyclase domain-containing protein
LKGYFPNFNKKLISKALAFIVTLSGFLLGAQYMENWYTASACILAALLTIGVYFVEKKTWYDDFSVAYLLALVPFIIVNGCLTGMVTPEPIVWYSADHIMGTRIISIPVEDLFYNYDMLICVVLLYELLKKRSMKIA